MDYSLSDIAAVADGKEGFGGFGGMWGLLILFVLFCGGGFGFGGRNQAATTEELSAGFNFAGINNKLNEITAGIAGVNQNLGNAICTSTYELASKIDNCCCSTQLSLKDLAATVIAENAATRSMIQQDKIEGLQAQVNQLQLAQATCGLPRVNPYAYGVTPINFCGNGTCAY